MSPEIFTPKVQFDASLQWLQRAVQITISNPCDSYPVITYRDEQVPYWGGQPNPRMKITGLQTWDYTLDTPAKQAEMLSVVDPVTTQTVTCSVAAVALLIREHYCAHAPRLPAPY